MQAGLAGASCLASQCNKGHIRFHYVWILMGGLKMLDAVVQWCCHSCTSLSRSACTPHWHTNKTFSIMIRLSSFLHQNLEQGYMTGLNLLIQFA